MTETKDDNGWERVSVVTITHNSARVIEPCLTSVRRAARVVVVDNASDDDTVAIVRRVLPSLTLICNPVNLGFGIGCNQGLKRVETEFALLLGPDSTIDNASLSLLVQAADSYPEAGLLGPSLIALDGHVELSHDLDIFQRMTARKRLDAGLVPEGPLCAGDLSGAVLLVRRTALQQVGGFDPNIFLYFEDNDLCLRMTAGGWSLVLVPQARASHIGGGSSRATFSYHWKKYWHMSWSRLYIEAKYRGRTTAVITGLQMLARFFVKALSNALCLKRHKSIRDAARFTGALAYLLGMKAIKPMWYHWPEQCQSKFNNG